MGIGRDRDKAEPDITLSRARGNIHHLRRAKEITVRCASENSGKIATLAKQSNLYRPLSLSRSISNWCHL